MKDLAIEIHIRHMKKKDYKLPDVADLISTAFDVHEPESITDLTLSIKCIEDCIEHWDSWSAEWFREEQESKSQAKWEDANRGEI